MEQGFKMKPWATDENAVMVTTFTAVISYFSQTAHLLYFGDDRPDALMDAAYKTLDEYPDNAMDEQIFQFEEQAHRREEMLKRDPKALEFEKKSLERLAMDGKKGDGLSAKEGIDGSYFLNSFSWSILSGCASEEQIAAMLDPINKYVKTEAGLMLSSP